MRPAPSPSGTRQPAPLRNIPPAAAPDPHKPHPAVRPAPWLAGLAGGVAGCGLALALLRAFQALGPEALPRLGEASIDGRVLAFAMAAALASGLAAGLAALRSPRGLEALGGARSTARPRAWLRGALVTAQIAVSLVLLAGAGLLLRSLWNLEAVPLGMNASHVLTASFSLGRQRYADPARQLAFFTELERHLAALPGAEAVAITDSLPPTGGTRARPLSTIEIEGRPRRPEGTGGMVAWRYVTPGYFAALGIPIRRGRGFTEADRAPGADSIVLSETLARQMFPHEDPLGRHVLRLPEENGWFTVIGVAADVRDRGPAEAGLAEYYVVRKPAPDVTWNQQEPPMGWRSAFALVRTPLDPRAASAELRRTLAAIDPTLPVNIATMSGRLEGITGRPRFYASLLGAFAAIGVLLAAIGLFGVISFLVEQGRREIGVRMALGATPRDVLRHVLGQALRWTLAGMALGIPAALATARLLRSLLFRVAPFDPGALIAAAVLLAAVAILAAAAPAWRAARLDPAAALRE